jgi:hypothetical protein
MAESAIHVFLPSSSASHHICLHEQLKHVARTVEETKELLIMTESS